MYDLLDINFSKVNGKDEITDVSELKYLKIELKKCKPFKRDYHNFQSFNNLLVKANIKFHIIYNEFLKEGKSRKDDIIKMFNIKQSSSFAFEESIIMTIHV